jgi:N-methylhydantoinase B
VGQQVIEAVWDSLAKVIPEKTPAGWGGFASFVFNGIDPRRNEGYATPDFLANTNGGGAIWGTDGWHAACTPVATGGITFPEVEVCELSYPALWTNWELITDSGGPGRWSGGAGMKSVFVLEADEMELSQQGEHYHTLPGPAVAGGRVPPDYCRQVITRSNGEQEEGGEPYYVLKRGETLACYCNGGCGVGNPLEREVEAVREDVLNRIVSPEKAREIYGVIIDPDTFEVDHPATQRMRSKKLKG